jgi:hypothetical protein
VEKKDRFRPLSSPVEHRGGCRGKKIVSSSLRNNGVEWRVLDN